MDSATLKLVCSHDLVTADLGLPPAERVESFLRMLDAQRISHKEIAQRTGASKRTVQSVVRKLKLDPSVEVTPARAGFPSRYLFKKPLANGCAPHCDALRRNAPRQTDYPKPQCAAAPAPTSTSVPPPPETRNSQFHTTHRTYHAMGHGFNTHGSFAKKRGHGKKWNFTRKLLGDDVALQVVAADYSAMGWIPAGESGLVIVFEAAEHALGSKKVRTVGGLFTSRVKDWRQREFHPITQAAEGRARLRLKRVLYGESPTHREPERFEEEIH